MKQIKADAITWSDVKVMQERIRDLESYQHAVLGKFTVSKREATLIQRLIKYYADTPYNMCNKEVFRYWMLFSQWAKDHYYSWSEISAARRWCEANHLTSELI